MILRVYKDEYTAQQLSYFKQRFEVVAESAAVLSIAGELADLEKVQACMYASEAATKLVFSDFMSEAEQVEAAEAAELAAHYDLAAELCAYLSGKAEMSEAEYKAKRAKYESFAEVAAAAQKYESAKRYYKFAESCDKLSAEIAAELEAAAVAYFVARSRFAAAQLAEVESSSKSRAKRAIKFAEVEYKAEQSAQIVELKAAQLEAISAAACEALAADESSSALALQVNSLHLIQKRAIWYAAQLREVSQQAAGSCKMLLRFIAELLAANKQSK